MCVVSVIIPTYKHRDFVLETIASVKAQTFTDWELIIINDGSPDDTHEILQPVLNCPKIRYIRQENQGQSAARNKGIAMASGKYLALLDDDDLWPVDKLEWQVAGLEKHSDWGVLAGTYQQLGLVNSQTYPINAPKSITFEGMFEGCPCVSPGQYLIRMSIIKEIGGFNPRIWGADDYDLLLRLSSRGPVQIEDRVALYYRLHANNASNDSMRMYQNAMKAIDWNVANLPIKKQLPARRLGYEFIYRYYGMPLFWIWYKQLFGGNYKKTLKILLTIVSMFFKYLRFYPQKIPVMLHDMLPGIIRRMIHGNSSTTVSSNLVK